MLFCAWVAGPFNVRPGERTPLRARRFQVFNGRNGARPRGHVERVSTMEEVFKEHLDI